MLNDHAHRVVRARHDLCSPLQTLLSIFAMAPVAGEDHGPEIEELLLSVEATGLAAKQLTIRAVTPTTVADESPNAELEAPRAEFERTSAKMSALLNAYLATPEHARFVEDKLATVQNVIVRYDYTLTSFREALSQLIAEGSSEATEEIDVAVFVTNLARSFRTDAESKGLGLYVNVKQGAILNTRVHLLGGILQNVVANAIKYTDQGNVALHCDADDHWVSIRVVDSGIGMNAETIQRATEAGFRARNSDVQSRPDEGLGLASAAAAASSLNAMLTFDSNGAGWTGTVVTLRLPRSRL